jgi:hypothetical protein
MDSKAPNKVVAIRKGKTLEQADILRDLQKAVAGGLTLELMSSASQSLSCGEFEASAFDNLRHEVYRQMIITMVAVAERHGVDLYSDKNQGRAFRRIAILEAEIAARSAMGVALREVNASDWDSYVLSGPHDTPSNDRASVNSHSETREQKLQTALQTLEADLQDVRPGLTRQLQPLARLIEEHGIPSGMSADRAHHALRESAYRGMTDLAAQITTSYGFDVTQDKDASDAFLAIMLRSAFSIADELLGGLVAKNVPLASSSIN